MSKIRPENLNRGAPAGFGRRTKAANGVPTPEDSVNALQVAAEAEQLGTKGKRFQATTVVRQPGVREQNFDYTEVVRALKPVRAIHFHDDLQDFLVWYVAANGVVVCSEPFQTSVWAGTVMINVRIGRCPTVRTRDGTIRHIKHKVTKVEELSNGR